MKVALIGRYGEGEILPGPERVARELYLQLKQNNINVTFIEYFFSGYGDYSLFKKIFGKKINHNNVLRLGIVPMTVKLIREQPDIIHFVNIQRFSLLIFFLKPFLKAKFISTLHGLNKTEVKESGLKRTFLDIWVEKKSISKSDALIFPSKYLFDLFNVNYSLPENKCSVIHNGISEVFAKNKIKFRDKEVYNFVYYNSFGKGLKELLNELHVVFKLPVRIFVIGNSEKVENLNSNIEIYFVPPMSQTSLLQFLSDKHFIIKSSVFGFDAFPTITIECMAMGIIPVVSESTGIKEIIENKNNGFIYREGNELSKLLKEIFDGKFNLNEISMNASRIYEKLNWDNVSEKYNTLYKSVL